MQGFRKDSRLPRRFPEQYRLPRSGLGFLKMPEPLLDLRQ
jgi:hypothetical protein